MDSWSVGGEGRLVRIEDAGDRCGEPGDAVYVLLDSAGDVERVWRDRTWSEEDSDCRLSHEVEGDELVSVLEETFEDGRTNHDREIEIEDLEPLPEVEDALEEESLRRRLRRFERGRRAD